MVSVMAEEVAARFEKLGVRLDFRELNRLNALGLAVERSPRSAETYTPLPRVAILGDGDRSLAIREPSVGHLLWIERTNQSSPTTDDVTQLKRLVYCLSNKVDDLCDPDSPHAVSKAVKHFFGWRGVAARWTLRQLDAACSYAIDGGDETDGEEAPRAKEDKPSKEPRTSFAAGVLATGVVCRLGTVDDVKRMTLTDVTALTLYVAAKESGDPVKFADECRKSESAAFYRYVDTLIQKYGIEMEKWNGVEQQ